MEQEKQAGTLMQRIKQIWGIELDLRVLFPKKWEHEKIHRSNEVLLTILYRRFDRRVTVNSWLEMIATHS